MLTISFHGSVGFNGFIRYCMQYIKQRKKTKWVLLELFFPLSVLCTRSECSVLVSLRPCLSAYLLWWQISSRSPAGLAARVRRTSQTGCFSTHHQSLLRCISDEAREHSSRWGCTHPDAESRPYGRTRQLRSCVWPTYTTVVRKVLKAAGETREVKPWPNTVATLKPYRNLDLHVLHYTKLTALLSKGT